jgi:1-acyl-sn-glycerol-3-phosphate acyltransferase
MRSLLTLVWWTILVPLDALWAFPWTFITRRIDALYRSAMWIAHSGLRIAGIRWKVIGYDRLDLSRNYIFMANHVSNIDPPLLIPLLPHRVTVLVKKELFKIPILGPAMRMGDFVPIDIAIANRPSPAYGRRNRRFVADCTWSYFPKAHVRRTAGSCRSKKDHSI